ncbi:MAG: PEP/pyruvate-binding domain-containing protein [Gemmatimonadales bacterium]
MPGVFHELERMARTLERHFRDVQDMEFTIEEGRLYMLQTPARAALRPGRLPRRVRDGHRGPDQRRGGRRTHSARRTSSSCCTR